MSNLALAMPPEESPERSLITSINAELNKAKKEGAHLLAPLTLQSVPPMHRPVLAVVRIDPDPKNKEVYPQRGGGLSLSALAFQKLADAMGIQWDPKQCGRIDDGRDPHLVHYRMVGRIKSLDGTWRIIMGDKEIRMETVVQELTDNYRAKAEGHLADPQDGPKFRKQCPTDAAVEEWIREKVRQDAIQIQKHMLARAQSGALARATKSIGIRETYTRDELSRPFVFPKLVFQPDPNHPQDRAFMLAQGAGAIDQLYQPTQPATAAQPALTALPEAEASMPVFLPPPGPSGTGESGQGSDGQLPTKDESLRADFKAADPKGQAQVLQALIKRKGWTKPLQGDLEKWLAAHRDQFFDTLMAMPDVESAPGGPALPF